MLLLFLFTLENSWLGIKCILMAYCTDATDVHKVKDLVKMAVPVQGSLCIFQTLVLTKQISEKQSRSQRNKIDLRETQ